MVVQPRCQIRRRRPWSNTPTPAEVAEPRRGLGEDHRARSV